jgi:hypothetical protein
LALSIQRLPKDQSAGVFAVASVSFYRFSNSGKAFNGEDLGARDGGAYYLNAIELTFKVTDATVTQRYRNLKPYQWSGPDAIWLQRGTAAWTLYRSTQGGGADPPLDENWQTTMPTIAYYDNPGLQPAQVQSLDSQGATRIHVVQNFTGWVVGYPVRGGDAEQLSETIGWYSRVSIAKNEGKWSRDLTRCGSTIGWFLTTQTP